MRTAIRSAVWRRMLSVLAVTMLVLSGCGASETSRRGQSTVYEYTLGTVATVTAVADSPEPTDGTAADTTDDVAGRVPTEPAATATGKSSAPSAHASATGRTTASRTTATQTVRTTAAPRGGELRAAWVSYFELADILKGCTTAAKASKAIDSVIAQCKAAHLNTVIFHARANSDAYYASKVFQPAAVAKPLLAAGFDPLAYAVREAHRCGLQLHAWINPYRIGKQESYRVAGVPTLTDAAGRYYYVPTSTAAQKLILSGIREILENYAVDGIQFDDYFYPSGTLGKTTIYSYESADYTAYRNGGGTLSVADWRRAGVDSLIAATHTLTAAHGKVFGVSPAMSADDTYENLYADCRKWMKNAGYIDYICPQLYTGFEHKSSAFDVMLSRWQSYPRDASVQLYVGFALYKAGLKNDTYAGPTGKTEWAQHDDILKREVVLARSAGIHGLMFYSYRYLSPETVSGLSSTNAVAVMRREVDHLSEVL